MVQSLQFSLDESAAKTAPLVQEGSNAVIAANQPSAAPDIEDSVTLSREARAALLPSNLLIFARLSAAALSTRAAGTTTFGGSQIQKFLDEGYSLSQIASEFHIALAEVESRLAGATFDTAA